MPRIFTAAEAQTARGGSVVVLDSPGYGPMTIGQSISLIAPPGVYAGITIPGWNGIIITGTAARCAATSSVYGVAALGRTIYTPRLRETKQALHSAVGVVTSRGNNALQANTTNGAELSLNDGYIRRPR